MQLIRNTLHIGHSALSRPMRKQFEREIEAVLAEKEPYARHGRKRRRSECEQDF